MPGDDAALQAQLAYATRRSPLYRRTLADAPRVRSAKDLPRLPFLAKDDLRESQERDPPFGEHMCATRDELVRIHVTSGTTGQPVAIGLTQNDHHANSEVGGAAFAIAGVRPGHTIAHCLNYALYAGGIADHMALEATGATVVPVGVGQSRQLLELIPRLRIDAIFGTLSFPAYLARRAQEAGIEPRALGLKRIVTAGEPGGGLAAVRREIEDAWGAEVADTFGMSDVWSTMGGQCGEGEGLHLTTGRHAVLELIDPESGEDVVFEDGAQGELVWTHLRREASPLVRYRSSDLATVWRSRCACGRETPRIRIDGRRDDMLRVQAVNVYPQAVATLLASEPALGRHAVVAEGDPIRAPVHIYVEAGAGVDLGTAQARMRRELRADFRLVALAPGSLPVEEHKTRTVYRTARGDTLPPAVVHHRRSTPP